MKLSLVKLSSRSWMVAWMALLSVAALAMLTTLTVFLVKELRWQPLTPDQAYEELDPDMQPYPETGDVAPMERPAGGGAASFVCEAQVTVVLDEKRVSLMFANPGRSLQNAVIELVVQDTVVAQSGRIDAGYRVTSLPLMSRAISERGIYQGEIRMYFFDTASGAQVVNTACPVTVTVK